MKHVIICLGIGIFILFLFIYFGLIGEVSFTLLLIVNVACCLFVFYEPRIKKGSATASGIEVELSGTVEQINSSKIEQITNKNENLNPRRNNE